MSRIRYSNPKKLTSLQVVSSRNGIYTQVKKGAEVKKLPAKVKDWSQRDWNTFAIITS